MKKQKVVLLISILLLVTLVCSYPFFIDKLKIQWKNLVAPWPELQEFDEPEFLVEVPGLVYEFSWLEGSSSIRLSSSHWSCSTPDVPDTISYYDFSSKEVTFTTEEVPEDQEDSENFPEIFELDDSADHWVTCENKGVAVATGDFFGEEYWLKYWLDGDLVETFYFSSKQWKNSSMTPWVMLDFSPSCNKVVLILKGWIAYEQESNQELWLLDVKTNSFEQLVIGDRQTLPIWDYSVQQVNPIWSPNEDQFVFGGWDFGLEILDLEKDKQRLLVPPSKIIQSVKWSPSGEWIAGLIYDIEIRRNIGIYIISPDGSKYGYLDYCDSLEDFWWAPEEDKLIFSCQGICESLCPESCNPICGNDFERTCGNPCPSSEFLWLWDLE